MKNWDKDIQELESYFLKAAIPTQPIKLNKYSTIKDCDLFIKSHLATVKANNGNQTYLSYLNQLQELKDFLK